MRRPWPELALVGVAAAFALTFAGGSLWLDEAFSVQVAESAWPRFLELLRHDNGPPLHYALLKGWIALFGDGERPLRALSAVFAILAVPPAIALGRQVGGNRESGLATGLLFACSAQLALHARAARMYALVILLAAVTTWLWARWSRLARVEDGAEGASRTPGVRTPDGGARTTGPVLGALAFATALGAYSHYWFAFLTLAQVAAAVTSLRRRAWPLLAAAAAGWAPFLLWLPVVRGQLSNGSRAWIQPPEPWAPLKAFAGVLDPPATIALVALIAVLAWRQRARPDRPFLATAALVAVALLVPFALSLWRPIFLPVRHAAIAVPAVAALLGVALARVLQPRALVAILAGVLAVRGVTHAERARQSELREPGSDRSAAAFLAASASPGDAVIFVGLSGPAIRYYLRGSALELRAFPAEQEEHPAWIDPAAFSPGALSAEAAALDEALGARAVWLVGTGGDPIREALRARLSTRGLDRSARLDGLFYDRLERFRPR